MSALKLDIQKRVTVTERVSIELSEEQVLKIVQQYLVDHHGLEVKLNDINFDHQYEGSRGNISVSFNRVKED